MKDIKTIDSLYHACTYGRAPVGAGVVKAVDGLDVLHDECPSENSVRGAAAQADVAVRGPVLTRVPMPPLVSISTRMLWGSVPLIMATRSTPDSMA